MTSPTEELFARALGLEKPWTVTLITFSQTDQRLDIQVDFPVGSTFTCPRCQQKGCKAYDTTDKSWRHLDFFQYQAYVHARVPRIQCPKCGILQVELPWTRPGSGFTLLYEALIMVLAREMPVKAVARLLREHDTRIWRVIQHYVQAARDKDFYFEVTRLGIDETSRRKGHQYVTLFVDLEEARVIFATAGKDSATIGCFSNYFHDQGGDSEAIKDICCDLSPAFISGVEECFPNARITFDRFHVMKLMGQAVDQVRRAEQTWDRSLKGSRYVWLKNPENLSLKQQDLLARMLQQHRPTARAYQIRLSLRDFFNQSADQAEDYLKSWYFWATHSRLAPVIEVAHMVKRHWQGILNFTRTRISNGLLEGINSLVQAARTKARGYRTAEYFITMIYLIAGKLNLGLPT
jgi:transposase